MPLGPDPEEECDGREENAQVVSPALSSFVGYMYSFVNRQKHPIPTKKACNPACIL